MNENQNEYVDINAHDNYPDSEQKIEVPTMKVIPLKKICMTIGELPSSYLETMTYYEMLVWFINYLRDNIIPTVNGNAAAVQEVQNVVMELQNYINEYKDSIDSDVEELEEYMNNYFENLDVQEEINNKLDQMLEDGVLTEIIQQFLQSTAIWCFDNVNEMKEATNLINGSFARTLGYYVPNDGGGATYKITNTESQTEYQEELNSGLYATLIVENVVNAKQLGAYGDNIHDDTTNVIKAINYTKENTTLYFPDGSYLISNTLTINKNINIKSDGIIISDNCRPLFILDKCINTIIDIYKIHDKRQNNLLINESEINNTPIVLKNTQYVKINIEEIKNFNIGILLISSNEATWGGCYYNSIHVKKFDTCFHGIYLLSLTGGSTNGNIFNDMVYQYHTWDTEEIPYFVTIKNISGNNYYNNSNMFYKLMAEYGLNVNGGPRLLNLVNGQSNYFEFDRSEIASTSHETPFVFENGARCNRVMTNFFTNNFVYRPDARSNYVYCPIQYPNSNHANNLANVTNQIIPHENITINSGIVFNDYINGVVYMHLVLQTTDNIPATQNILTGVPTPIEHIQHYAPTVENTSLYVNATKLVPLYISRALNTVVNRTTLATNQTLEIDLVYRTKIN